MLVKCDGPESCGKEFNLERFELTELDNGIEKTYFHCPLCNKEYVAFYTDPAIRKKQERMKRANSPYKRDKLFQEIGKDMKALREKIENETR